MLVLFFPHSKRRRRDLQAEMRKKNWEKPPYWDCKNPLRNINCSRAGTCSFSLPFAPVLLMSCAFRWNITQTISLPLRQLKTDLPPHLLPNSVRQWQRWHKAVTPDKVKSYGYAALEQLFPLKEFPVFSVTSQGVNFGSHIRTERSRSGHAQHFRVTKNFNSFCIPMNNICGL